MAFSAAFFTRRSTSAGVMPESTSSPGSSAWTAFATSIASCSASRPSSSISSSPVGASGFRSGAPGALGARSAAASSSAGSGMRVPSRVHPSGRLIPSSVTRRPVATSSTSSLSQRTVTSLPRAAMTMPSRCPSTSTTRERGNRPSPAPSAGIRSGIRPSRTAAWLPVIWAPSSTNSSGSATRGERAARRSSGTYVVTRPSWPAMSSAVVTASMSTGSPPSVGCHCTGVGSLTSHPALVACSPVDVMPSTRA